MPLHFGSPLKGAHQSYHIVPVPNGPHQCLVWVTNGRLWRPTGASALPDNGHSPLALRLVRESPGSDSVPPTQKGIKAIGPQLRALEDIRFGARRVEMRCE